MNVSTPFSSKLHEGSVLPGVDILSKPYEALSIKSVSSPNMAVVYHSNLYHGYRLWHPLTLSGLPSCDRARVHKVTYRPNTGFLPGLFARNSLRAHCVTHRPVATTLFEVGKSRGWAYVSD